MKGAYLATEALGSMAVGITKAIVFQRFDALPLETALRGLLIGSSLMIGSRLAKGFVLRLDADRFRLLMDLLLAGLGPGAAVGRVRAGALASPPRHRLGPGKVQTSHAQGRTAGWACPNGRHFSPVMVHFPH